MILFKDSFIAPSNITKNVASRCRHKSYKPKTSLVVGDITVAPTHVNFSSLVLLDENIRAANGILVVRFGLGTNLGIAEKDRNLGINDLFVGDFRPPGVVVPDQKSPPQLPNR